MTKNDTQKWKKERAIEIKERHAVGDIITDMEELGFILGTLLNNHPNKKEKIGPGVMHIRIDLNQRLKKAYTIIRVDGTETALGIYKGIGIIKDNIRTAARNATESVTLAYRDKRFSDNTYTCDICHRNNLYDTGFDVHHSNKEFDEIYREWRKLDTTQYLDMTMAQETSAHEPPRFKDQATTDSFLSYHDTHATLMLLCKPCHYAQKKKKGDGNNGNTTTTTTTTADTNTAQAKDTD